ncbi:MAG: DUF3035 domain-containing protein [Gemmobacter sp.]
MRAGRIGLGVAGVAMLVLAACGSREGEPRGLMNLRQSGQGPDEFAIVPPRPLAMPASLTDLPDPTPRGTNRTDPTPNEDAITALGGRPGAGAGADAGLAAHVGRHGRAADIREVLEAEDREFRRRNPARPLERLFGLNAYYRVYRGQALDQDAELDRWRRAGARTPSATPPGAR